MHSIDASTAGLQMVLNSSAVIFSSANQKDHKDVFEVKDSFTE